jgi:hypothetical protein
MKPINTFQEYRAWCLSLGFDDLTEIYRTWRVLWYGAIRSVTYDDAWALLKERKGIKGGKKRYTDASTAVEDTAT